MLTEGDPITRKFKISSIQRDIAPCNTHERVTVTH